MDSMLEQKGGENKIPGPGIFYLRYRIGCRGWFWYPYQYESVEIYGVLGKPTATWLNTQHYAYAISASKRIHPTILPG